LAAGAAKSKFVSAALLELDSFFDLIVVLLLLERLAYNKLLTYFRGEGGTKASSISDTVEALLRPDGELSTRLAEAEVDRLRGDVSEVEISPGFRLLGLPGLSKGGDLKKKDLRRELLMFISDLLKICKK
jgi:hypothetical protein